MAAPGALRHSYLHLRHLPPLPRPLAAARFTFSSSSSSPPAPRRHRPPPTHEFSKPCEFLGSWLPAADPREAEARLDRFRKDYAKQVARLRKEYAHEMEMLRFEKQRKDEARREAARAANEERRKAKAVVAETLASQRKVFQEEFRQTLLNERAERLESWRKKEEQREKKKTEKKELLRQQSSMWISDDNLDKRTLEAMVGRTPL